MARQLAKTLRPSEPHGWARFVTMQSHYNLAYQEEREVNPLCRDKGIGLRPWSPLARGFQAGNCNKADRGDTSRAKTDDLAHKFYYQDAGFAGVNRVREVVEKRDVPNAQVALG